MRIAILGTRGIPARHGGFETCVQEISTRFVKMGHEVVVYCRQDLRDEEYEGVKLVRFPSLRKRFVAAPLNSLLVTLHACVQDFDILHYFGGGHVPFILIARLCSRARIVLTVDGLEWLRTGYSRAARAYLRAVAELAMVFPHATVADSPSSQSWLQERTGVKPKYIPYGVEISSAIDEDVLKKYNLKKDGYLFFSGRLVHEKGVHTLVEASKWLRGDFDVVVIGGTTEDDGYVSTLRTLAGKRVRFLGYVYGKEYETLRNASLIYIHPSLLEGMSVSLLGAMGAGRCIVASNLKENYDVLADTAVYFRSGDSKDLAEKINSLLANPERVEELGKSARERAKRMFHWDEVAKAYEETYLDLLSKKGGR